MATGGDGPSGPGNGNYRQWGADKSRMPSAMSCRRTRITDERWR